MRVAICIKNGELLFDLDPSEIPLVRLALDVIRLDCEF